VRLSDRDARLASDTVARFGGDEFVLLAEGLRHHEDSKTIAQRVAGQFSEPFTIADEQLFVTASTGVAVSDGGSTPHSLIRDADAAMYHAKERGRARFEVFDDTLRGRLLDRLGREKDLRHALEANELSLYYQPIFGVASGSIIGAEALIRWHHPTRGLVSADQFIPLAEETGLIRQIDRWTVGQACRQLAAWQAAGGPYSHMTLSVNLSARQVEDGVFVDRLASALAESGAPAHLLALEITETVLIENTEAPIAVLSALRRLGPRLVLDDFGTGYSSLSYLQRFPLDAIKLDRAFAHGIAQPGRDREIVAALLHLARVLDLDVVAEGVETAAQFACLKDLGCRFAQGYHLGRPMPVELLEQVIETNRASSLETGIGTPDLPDPHARHIGGSSQALQTGS
jgi:EAL domain-containing protein (putative c-di-GMP-specific phosphodiesterase class I)